MICFFHSCYSLWFAGGFIDRLGPGPSMNSWTWWRPRKPKPVRRRWGWMVRGWMVRGWAATFHSLTAWGGYSWSKIRQIYKICSRTRSYLFIVHFAKKYHSTKWACLKIGDISWHSHGESWRVMKKNIWYFHTIFFWEGYCTLFQPLCWVGS